MLVVPVGTDIKFKEYRPGIETRVRRAERIEVEDGVHTRDISVSGARVRAYENQRTKHWELWQCTQAGWEYIVDWLGPNGEYRYFSETGMRRWLYEHRTDQISRYDAMHHSELQAKHRDDRAVEQTAADYERMYRSFDKRFGWRDHVGTE